MTVADVSGRVAVKGEQYLKKRAQFGLVYEKGNSWINNMVVVKALPNGLDLSRYGLSVGKRVGKAVQRNRVKRLLREILRVLPLKPGWDIIFIARVPASTVDFSSLQKKVIELLHQAQLIAE